MRKIKLPLIFASLLMAIMLTSYISYNRYTNLQDTMEIQHSIFQLVELRSANAQWDFELNRIHSDNFPHFDLVNAATVIYENEMAILLSMSGHTPGPISKIESELVTLSAAKKERMKDYLTEVALTRNSLKFLDTLLFYLNSKYVGDDTFVKFLAQAQYQLSMYVALNQNIKLKQHMENELCSQCNAEQRQAYDKVKLHLSLLKNKILLSHRAKDAFYNPEHAKLLTSLFDELSQAYVEEESKHQNIQAQILTITGILVLAVIMLLSLLYWIYRTIEGHRTAGITDPLTGLYNRKKLFDGLQSLMDNHDKSGKKLALLFIDLDGFKSVNDTFGHDVGDKLLQRLANRLNKSVRKYDSIYRIGGDEFVILLQELDKADMASSIAKDILERCNQPYQLESNLCHITLSIGISLYPNHTRLPKKLIRYADEAMYQAKSQGKSRVEIWRNH